MNTHELADYQGQTQFTLEAFPFIDESDKRFEKRVNDLKMRQDKRRPGWRIRQKPE